MAFVSTSQRHYSATPAHAVPDRNIYCFSWTWGCFPRMDRLHFVASRRHEIGLYGQRCVRKRDFLSLNGDRVRRAGKPWPEQMRSASFALLFQAESDIKQRPLLRLINRFSSEPRALPVPIPLRFGLPKVRTTPGLDVFKLPMSPFDDTDYPSYRSVLLNHFQQSSISAGFCVAISGQPALPVALIDPRQNQYLSVN